MTTIRPALPEEFPVIGELAVRAYTEAGMLPKEADYAAELRDVARRAEHAEVLVAVEGDKPTGTVTVVLPGSAYAEVARPDELEFRMLAVAPEAAGQGVGQALVDAVIDRAREHGARRLVLCVQEQAETPQRLYRRLGFVRLPDRDWLPIPSVRLVGYGLQL